MSTLERRLQILIDQHRFSLIEREAKQSGQSIAAVIRTAIDEHFDDEDTRRRDAARRFLELTQDPPEGVEDDWETIKAAIEEDLGRAGRHL